ncbi:MAG TPA: CdaR family protein [Treponemataceae bacterium]|nr:CdaR family protein [Treponemataceae bacterium]
MNIQNLIDKTIENWPAKIICLTLALLLFLFYRMSTLEERFFSSPLEIENSGTMVPASLYPRMIKISLRGEMDSIYPIQESDVGVFLDLSSITKEGEYRLPVQIRLQGTAIGIDPLEVSVDPSQITLRVEHRLVKKVAVTPSFKGYPEAGFEFNGYTVRPSVLELDGPRSAIEKISELTTEFVDLTGLNESFEGIVSVLNKNMLISISGDGKINYKVTINKTTLIKNFEEVPFYFENLDPDLEIDTDIGTGSIQIKGTQNELENWTLPENTLTILCENVKDPGEYSLPVHAIVPAPFEVLANSPNEIQISIRRRDN